MSGPDPGALPSVKLYLGAYTKAKVTYLFALGGLRAEMEDLRAALAPKSDSYIKGFRHALRSKAGGAMMDLHNKLAASPRTPAEFMQATTAISCSPV